MKIEKLARLIVPKPFKIGETCICSQELAQMLTGDQSLSPAEIAHLGQNVTIVSGVKNQKILVKAEDGTQFFANREILRHWAKFDIN